MVICVVTDRFPKIIITFVVMCVCVCKRKRRIAQCMIYLLNVYTRIPKDQPPFHIPVNQRYTRSSTSSTALSFEASLPSPLACWRLLLIVSFRRHHLMRHLLVILVGWTMSLRQMSIQRTGGSNLLVPQCIERTLPRILGKFSF